MTHIIAHRGASSERPENTIDAFKRAVELKADGIEFDVNLSSDGQAVVVHDFEQRDAAGLPTFSEACAYLAPLDIQIIVEIKPQKGFSQEIVNVCASMLRMFAFRTTPVVSSSCPLILRALAREAPEMPRAFIMRQPYFCFLQTVLFDTLAGIQGVHAQMKCVDSHFVSWCHDKGLYCYAWTARTSEDVVKMYELGVDAIIADDVSMARKALQSCMKG